MFGLFAGKAPKGPATFSLQADIGCPAERLFALVNPASPDFWQRAEGGLERVAPGRYRQHLDGAPERLRTFVVEEAEPGRVLVCTIQTTPRIDQMVSSQHRYTMAPAGSGNCTVTLKLEVRFVPGLGKRAYEHACRAAAEELHTTLTRLKIHAEQGRGMVCRIDRLQSAA